MTEAVQDSITKQITIRASQKQVYDAITNPERIVTWFPSGIEGTLEVGARPVLDFGEHGKNQIYVEAARPDEYFAYRWIPGSKHFIGDVLTEANTLVEFFIHETSDGIVVTVKESGFSSLPAETRVQKFADNNGGWEYMISRLGKLLNE
jgi:uncharacterized protein YndB with AHSA1/START domain